jgi:hypothetical protein
MSDPAGGLPNGINPTDPTSPDDSSLGGDRAAAIEAEKRRWRDKQAKDARSPGATPATATDAD